MIFSPNGKSRQLSQQNTKFVFLGRDHVSWHFVDELREMIDDPTKCPECSYIGEKLEAVTRHLALFHCKLDEFLQDEQLVASKRAKAMAKPKKVNKLSNNGILF